MRLTEPLFTRFALPAGRDFDPRLLTIGENVIQALYEYAAIGAYRFHGRL